ncbi:MAG: hypothetical protein AAFX41_11510 [Bacteroidota bacterium]
MASSALLLAECSPDAAEIVAHEQALYDLLRHLDAARQPSADDLLEQLRVLPLNLYAKRAAVARQLANRGHTGGFAEMERLAAHDAEDARWSAAYQLGNYLGSLPDRLRSLLSRLATDTSVKVRQTPVQTLGYERMPGWELTFLQALEQLAPDYDGRMLYWLSTRGSEPGILDAIERLLRRGTSEDHLVSAFVALLNLIKRDVDVLSTQARVLFETHWDILDPLWIAQSSISGFALAQLPRDLYDRIVEKGCSVPDPTPKQREHLLRLRERYVEQDGLAAAETLLESILPSLNERPVGGTPFRALADLAIRHPTLRAQVVDLFLGTEDLVEAADAKRFYVFRSVAYCLHHYGGARARRLLAQAVDVVDTDALRLLHWWRHGWSALDVLQALHKRGLSSHVPSVRALNAACNAYYNRDYVVDSGTDEALIDAWKSPDTALTALMVLGLLYYFDTERESPPHYHELIEEITRSLATCTIRLTARQQHFDREYYWLRDKVELSYHEPASVDIAIASEACAVRASISDSGDWVLMEDLLAMLNALPERLGWSERFVRVMGDGQAASIMFGDTEALNEVLDQFWLHPHTYDRRDWWEARRAELRAALLADAA